MDPERWQRIKAIYQDALDRPASERKAFVRSAADGDDALYREIVALLDVPAEGHGYIDDIVGNVSPLDDLPENARVGPYRLLGVIGQGGMGQVYLAERDDDEFQQRVAVKVANWLGAAPSLIERFRLERQILANLDHPNIARLLDGGTASGVPYLVMEYVDGQSILEYGKSRLHGLRTRLELFLKICDAVQYAHTKLVVHRDIKPSNVLVTADGTPKLLDFGIAKLLDAAGDEPVTRADARVLTPEYASPEQLLGAPVTTATDVYGLGLLLYQLLAGALPFDLSSKTSPEIRELICHTEPVAPSLAARGAGDADRASRLRGDLDNIVMMALRKDPARRYATVKDLADDVAGYLSDQPVRARGDRWSYRASKFLKRHRMAAVVTALVVTAIAAQTGFYTRELADERDRALDERRVAENTTEFLVDLFEVSDPAQSSGETVTAREILDRGAVKIREELSEDDAIRARMLQTIGRVYERLGLYDDARALMEEAVALNRRALGPTDRLFIDSLDELAWLYYRQEDWQRAFDTAKEALDIQQAAAGGDEPSMARTLNHLGTIVYYLDDIDGSLDYYRRALAVLDTPDWATSDVRVTTLNHTGIVYETLGRYDEAETVYRQSLALRLQKLGEDHPDLSIAYANLAALLINTGRYDEARGFVEKSLAINRKARGEQHVNVAFDLDLLANIETRSGNPGAALAFATEAAAIWRAVSGPAHSRFARSLDELAEIYRQLDRLDEAADYGQQSLAILLDGYGAEHTLTSDPQFTLGKIYSDRGDYDEAERQLRDALRIRVTAWGDGHPAVWDVRHMLAKNALRRGDAAAALVEAERTLALVEAAGQTGLPIHGWLVQLKSECEAQIESGG